MRKSRILPAIAGLALLAGCATTPSEPSGSSGDLTPVTVGVIPIVDVAAVYLGVEQGFFEDEGLDVSLELAQGGAAIVPAVVSGEYEFGFSNVTSLLLATSNGVPLQLVAAGAYTTGDTEADVAAVVVPEDSTIESPADLAGATVAVNTLNNIGDSTVREVVEAAGGDPEAIQFVEMGFPDMPAAIASNQVDAAWVVEPHLTRAVQAGARVISSTFAEVDPNLMIASYFTSDALAASDPETVDAFRAAMETSLQYAADNPDAARAVLDQYTEIDPAIAEAMTMPRFSPELSRDSVQLLADLAERYGLVSSPVAIDELLP